VALCAAFVGPVVMAQTAMAPLAAAQGSAAPPAAVRRAVEPPSVLRLTLAEAVRRGVDSSLQRQEVAQSARRAEAQRRQARAARRPQLASAVQWQWNVQNQFESLFGNAGTPPPPVRSVADPLFRIFGAEYQLGLGATLSQVVFDGGRRRSAVQVGTATVEATTQAAAAARAAAVLGLVDAYTAAQLAEVLATLADSNAAYAEQFAQQTEQLWRAGTLPEFDHLRALLVRDAAAPDRLRARDARELAHFRLRQLLGASPQDSLVLDTPLDTASTLRATMLAGAGLDHEPSPGTAETPRAVAQARYEVMAAEAQHRSVLAQRWPSLAVQSSYQRLAYSTVPLPRRTDLFLPQFSVGFGITHGTWTGGRWAADRALSQAGVDMARVRLQCVQQQAALQAREAQLRVQEHDAAWQASGRSIATAERALAIAEVRLREGLATAVEVTDVRRQLQQARANRAGAVRDLIVARARAALLPDLPVGSSTDSPCALRSR
jgi:outer membrane protein TolC